MRATATIQLTTIELVMGKPNGLAISTAFCERPGSSCSAPAGVDPGGSVVLDDMVESLVNFASATDAHVAPTNMNTKLRSSAIRAVFELGKTWAPCALELECVSTASLV